MFSIRGITKPQLYCPQIESAIENTKILPAFVEIDAITGATHSSNNANDLMSKGLEAILSGETGTIQIDQPESKK